MRPSCRRHNLTLISFGWLLLSLFWAVVIIVTGALAWPLALWVATTLGPLTLLRNRIDNPPSGGPDEQ